MFLTMRSLTRLGSSSSKSMELRDRRTVVPEAACRLASAALRRFASGLLAVECKFRVSIEEHRRLFGARRCSLWSILGRIFSSLMVAIGWIELTFEHSRARLHRGCSAKRNMRSSTFRPIRQSANLPLAPRRIAQVGSSNRFEDADLFVMIPRSRQAGKSRSRLRPVSFVGGSIDPARAHCSHVPYKHAACDSVTRTISLGQSQLMQLCEGQPPKGAAGHRHMAELAQLATSGVRGQARLAKEGLVNIFLKGAFPCLTSPVRMATQIPLLRPTQLVRVIYGLSSMNDQMQQEAQRGEKEGPPGLSPLLLNDAARVLAGAINEKLLPASDIVKVGAGNEGVSHSWQSFALWSSRPTSVFVSATAGRMVLCSRGHVPTPAL